MQCKREVEIRVSLGFIFTDISNDGITFAMTMYSQRT